MELRCWDPECAGNDLPAGEAGPDRVAPACSYCGESLERDGRVVAAAPVSVEGVTAELTAVPAGDQAVLACALTENGEVLAASVYVGDEALRVERLMVALGG